MAKSHYIVHGASSTVERQEQVINTTWCCEYEGKSYTRYNYMREGGGGGKEKE